jgi:Ca2+/H+ antiporter
MGASMLAGGLKYPTQNFNAGGARSQATMLILAVIASSCRRDFIIWAAVRRREKGT